MTRPIKFRAWSKHEKIWLHENRLTNPKNVPVIPDGYCFSLNQKHVIFCQFTGLLDKNGNEIYEGDIVNCLWGRGQISYIDKEAGFMFCDENNLPTGTAANIIDYEAEVIGNIYENPELLK